MVAGAASFMAAKVRHSSPASVAQSPPQTPAPVRLTLPRVYPFSQAYEEHCKRHGKPTDHAKAVELMAGLAGGAIDKVSLEGCPPSGFEVHIAELIRMIGYSVG